MAYKLEHVLADHMGLLSTTLQKWGSDGAPDLFIISEEGHKIYTRRMILSFYSPSLSSMLSSKDVANEDFGITVAAPSNSIVHLLKVLASGIAIANRRCDLENIAEIAKLFGINFQNWQIGVKNNKNKMNESAKKSLKAIKPKSNIFEKRKSEIGVKEEKEEKISNEEYVTTENNKYECEICQKSFQSRHHLTRHENIHSGVRFSCDVCPSTFSRKDKLSLHVRKSHGSVEDFQNQNTGVVSEETLNEGSKGDDEDGDSSVEITEDLGSEFEKIENVAEKLDLSMSDDEVEMNEDTTISEPVS